MIRLVRHPDPRLKQPCREVSLSEQGELRAFVDGMLDVMYTNEGVGLAAPQVGWNVRVIIIDPSNGEDDKACRVMINPVLVNVSPANEECMEGCLSLPGELYNVERPCFALARWQDLEGKNQESWFSGPEARIFLHELDHLLGKLISDVGTRATLKHREDR